MPTWDQQRAQIPLHGHTKWVDQSGCVGSIGTKCAAHDGEPRC
jgi:hypothetical protein